MGELRAIKPADVGEFSTGACPWCGSEKHKWHACGRVRGFRFFGERAGPDDIAAVEFWPRYMPESNELNFEMDPEFWDAPSEPDDDEDCG